MNENIVLTFLDGIDNKQTDDERTESGPFSIISKQLKKREMSFPRWERIELKNDIKKYQMDQTEMMCTRQKVEMNIKKFKIRSFKRKNPDIISTPHFGIIEPPKLSTKISANAISIGTNDYPAFLKSDAFYSSKNNSLPNNSAKKNFVTLKRKKETVDIDSSVSYLFQSILMSSKPLDENDDEMAQDFHDIDMRKESNNRSFIMLPPLVNTPIYDYEVVEFELNKIKKARLKVNRYIPYNSNEITEEMIVSKGVSSKSKKSLFNIEDLFLSSGEYIVIESIDEKPIIQPIVGMTSQLSVLINGESETKNDFDERIPVVKVTNENSNYFLSPLPKNKYILMYLNTVVNAALAQHKPKETDFILTIGSNVKIFPLPKTIYLSTSYEPRVIVPAPVKKKPGYFLKVFERPDLPTPEYFCKQRSIYYGVSDLRSKGIISRNKAPKIPKYAIAQINKLPQKMKIMIKRYLEYLKSTPWHKSLAYAKGRIGNFQSIDSIQQTEQTHRVALLKELQTCFENKLLFIESNGGADNQNEMDSFDFDFDLLMNDEEEEEGEILLNDDDKDGNSGAFPHQNDLHKTRIDWKKYGMNDFPKRPLLKIIETKYEDSNAFSQIHWIRDKTIIANARKRAQVSHASFDDIYNKNEAKQIFELDDYSYESSSSE